MKKYFSSYWIRSGFYTVLQRFSVTIFGLINFMVLIRSLTKEQMGTWAIFLSITSIFEAAKSNLLKNAHIRFVGIEDSRSQKTAIAASSFLINIILTGVFILLIFAFGKGLNVIFKSRTDLSGMLICFIPGLIGMVFFSHFEAIQQSFLDFKGSFSGNFSRQVIFFALISFHMLFQGPMSLNRLAVYQSLSILAGACVLFVSTRRYLHFQFNASIRWIRDIFRYGGYIFSSGVIANVFANLDQLMTGSFLSSSSVAYYNTASRINGLVDIPSYAASEVLFPKISQASSISDGKGRVKYLYEKMVALLLSFTAPTAIFIIIFPSLIIILIAGKEYVNAAPILQLYMLTGLFRPMQNQAANLLNSIGKPALCMIVNAVSLVANLSINYLCLLYFGFYGAAIGTVITCLLGSAAWYYIMKKEIELEPLNILSYIKEYYKTAYTYGRSILNRSQHGT